uniref:Putative ovule protein n=1 Tax=Solanum chacoense TaxID=4108 RepID=A0A0V0GPW3_SOLCH
MFHNIYVFIFPFVPFLIKTHALFVLKTPTDLRILLHYLLHFFVSHPVSNAYIGAATKSDHALQGPLGVTLPTRFSSYPGL